MGFCLYERSFIVDVQTTWELVLSFASYFTWGLTHAQLRER
jgi:hypothetical protein